MLNSSLSLLILGLVCHLIVAEAQQICGPNQEFNPCACPCPVTCDNRLSNILCTMQCVAQCDCKMGFMRNSEGTCVRPHQC